MNRTPRGFVVIAFLIMLVLIVATVVVISSPRSSAGERQAAGPCPTGVPAISKNADNITTEDATAYVVSHPVPRNINAAAAIDKATVRAQATDLQTIQEKYLQEAGNGCPPTTQVIYVEFQAVEQTPGAEETREHFVFPGPAGRDAQYAVGFEVFLTRGGNLLEAGGKKQYSI